MTRNAMAVCWESSLDEDTASGIDGRLNSRPASRSASHNTK